MNYPRLHNSGKGDRLYSLKETAQAVQISIHPPSQFICANLERILPDWNFSDLWVVVVLQQSQYELVEIAPHVEREKECLREKFMRFGCEVAFNLRDRGFLADLIDPRTGYPLLSHPGEIPHDDTAVVKALLGFPVIHNTCRLLRHPIWGMAVYPSVFMSSASPAILNTVLKSVAIIHGWNQSKIDLQLSC